jgi:hypothetical protein
MANRAGLTLPYPHHEEGTKKGDRLSDRQATALLISYEWHDHSLTLILTNFSSVLLLTPPHL